MKIRRLPCNPIIIPHMDDRMGSNINGPSLIKVPDWIEQPLGRYYLYFANHGGTYIRLAYADDLAGPWRIHTPGTVQLADSHFPHHIASPDIHVDDERRVIRMYYHGCCLPPPDQQVTRVATSTDGLHFDCHPQILGACYWRVFEWDGYYYALAMPGMFYRSRDPLDGFELGPTLFTEHMRHAAVKLDGDVLSVFYSNAFDRPERILMSRIRLTPDWMEWQASEPVTVIEPELDYEGADLPLEASRRGAVNERARQLRDPCIYREVEKAYLLYSVAGEHGIAIAEIAGAA